MLPETCLSRRPGDPRATSTATITRTPPSFVQWHGRPAPHGTRSATAGGMPRGSKSKYTSKQKRQAHHIEASAKERGYSEERAAQIVYATVNKRDHGGKRGGSGRGRKSSRASSHAGGRASHRKSPRGGARASRARGAEE